MDKDKQPWVWISKQQKLEGDDEEIPIDVTELVKSLKKLL